MHFKTSSAAIDDSQPLKTCRRKNDSIILAVLKLLYAGADISSQVLAHSISIHVFYLVLPSQAAGSHHETVVSVKYSAALIYENVLRTGPRKCTRYSKTFHDLHRHILGTVYRYVYVTFKYSFLELLDKYRFASEFQKRSAGVPIPPGTHCNHLKINLGKSLIECLYHQFSLSKSKLATAGSNFYCFFRSSAFAIQTVTIESICHVILRKFTNIRFIFTMSILNSHLTDS